MNQGSKPASVAVTLQHSLLSTMASGPSVLSETRVRQKENHGVLTTDIDDAVDDFLERINNVAVKHGR